MPIYDKFGSYRKPLLSLLVALFTTDGIAYTKLDRPLYSLPQADDCKGGCGNSSTISTLSLLLPDAKFAQDSP